MLGFTDILYIAYRILTILAMIAVVIMLNIVVNDSSRNQQVNSYYGRGLNLFDDLNINLLLVGIVLIVYDIKFIFLLSFFIHIDVTYIQDFFNAAVPVRADYFFSRKWILLWLYSIIILYLVHTPSLYIPLIFFLGFSYGFTNEALVPLAFILSFSGWYGSVEQPYVVFLWLVFFFFILNYCGYSLWTTECDEMLRLFCQCKANEDFVDDVYAIRILFSLPYYLLGDLINYLNG